MDIPELNILGRIGEKYARLTRAEKRVADFVTSQPRDVLYVSITDLADKAGVAETTVFRFCKTLSLDGYQSFKMSLAHAVSQLGIENSFTLAPEITRDDSREDVCKKLMQAHRRTLEETFGKVSIDAVSKAVALMTDARRILLFGVGSSGVAAMEMREKFSRIMPSPEFVSDTHMQAMSASLLTADDLGFAFSHSGSTKDTLNIARIVKSTGAKLICVTRHEKSPLAGHADCVLSYGADEGPFQGGSLTAHIAQLYLVDILYTEFFKQNYARSHHNKERTTEAIADFLL